MTWLATTTSILSPIICSFYLGHPGLLLTAPGSHQLKSLFITDLSSKIHLLNLDFHSHSIKNSTQIPNLYNHSFMLSESLSLVPSIYSLYCSYFLCECLYSIELKFTEKETICLFHLQLHPEHWKPCYTHSKDTINILSE